MKSMKFLSVSLLVLSFGSSISAGEYLTKAKDFFWTKASTTQKALEVGGTVLCTGAAAYYFSPTVKTYVDKAGKAVKEQAQPVISDSKKCLKIGGIALGTAALYVAYKSGYVSSLAAKLGLKKQNQVVS